MHVLEVVTELDMAEKTIATNRKAYRDYAIQDRFEAGLVLTGTEIKSIREGRVNLQDSFARLEDGELWLLNMHIAQYQAGSRYNHEPKRPRKLLLHRKEIDSLASKVLERGLTLVPLRLYIKRGIAKVELGVARGRKLYDKRQVIMKREAKREIERAVKVKRTTRG